MSSETAESVAGSQNAATSAETSSSAQSTAAASGGSNSISTQPLTFTSSAANRSAKIRRMMIAARRPGAVHGRAGVIIDRARAVLPASSIPEDLIAQAQVVLQGKSREVIVRELQRTNLNVNEAVNNLLSRDDDEGKIEELFY